MKRKGSSEIVSIVIMIVLFGALAIAITGSITKQMKANTDSGLSKTTTQFEQVVTDINP